MSELVEQLRRRGIRDPRVLDAMRHVRRRDFVPPDRVAQADEDRPLPIGHGQTISQPYIVALMTEMARPRPTDRALDVGTGCGYQAAILAELVRDVRSIEVVPELAREASRRLGDLGYDNIQVKLGDGYQGWPEAAPFDLIIVAAAPPEIPEPLIEQLAPGGRLVVPVGGPARQDLWLLHKQDDGQVRRVKVAPVMFVPLVHPGRE